MRSNGSRSKKHSKDAKAERILQSLILKNKSSLAPSSKKIRKRRRSAQDSHFELRFRTSQNHRKTLLWIMPTPPSTAKRLPAHSSKTPSARRRPLPLLPPLPRSRRPSTEQVNYADLFETAYQEFKTESSASGSRKPGVTSEELGTEAGSQNRAGDSYSGIEYDPKDNYFYLVCGQNAEKKELFENKGTAGGKGSPCLVINPTVVEGLKKDFALEAFLY